MLPLHLLLSLLLQCTAVETLRWSAVLRLDSSEVRLRKGAFDQAQSV
jgi:hypothetical protein